MWGIQLMWEPICNHVFMSFGGFVWYSYGSSVRYFGRISVALSGILFQAGLVKDFVLLIRHWYLWYNVYELQVIARQLSSCGRGYNLSSYLRCAFAVVLLSTVCSPEACFLAVIHFLHFPRHMGSFSFISPACFFLWQMQASLFPPAHLLFLSGVLLVSTHACKCTEVQAQWAYPMGRRLYCRHCGAISYTAYLQSLLLILGSFSASLLRQDRLAYGSFLRFRMIRVFLVSLLCQSCPSQSYLWDLLRFFYFVSYLQSLLHLSAFFFHSLLDLLFPSLRVFPFFFQIWHIPRAL